MAKLSGPRLRTGGYYSKGKKRGRPKGRATGRGLTKVETKQVKTIAKQAVKATAESKYFNVTNMNQFVNMSPNAPSTVTSAYSVLGFAVSTGALGGTQGRVQYGYLSGAYQEVHAMNMTRLFNSSDGTVLEQNALEGSYCAPALSKSEWYFNYPSTRTESTDTEGYPIMIRFIRVKPKNLKYASVAIQPREDLFLDQYNKATGVAGAGVFTEIDAQMLVLNRRKYTVIEDTKKILYPTTIINTARVSTGDTVTHFTDRPYEWRHTCNHAQPKKLYYENASIDAGEQPKAGQSNELVFVHYIALGQAGSVLMNANNIKLNVKCCGTFKDI